jgi:hypothetical protein
VSRQLTVLVGVACLLAGTAVAAEGVGTVFQTQYNGALGRLNQNERQLYYTKPVYTDEVVHTGKQSSTALLFLDQTRLQVGANSDVVLDRYVYDPGTGIGQVAITFGSGIFRFVSGEMKNKEGYHLKTPSATMAIRGTKLIIYVDEKGNTIAYMERGEGTCRSCGGSQADVHANQSAVVPIDCSKVSVVDGNLTPADPAVVADLPVPLDLVVQPEAGPPPAEHDYRDEVSPH